MASGGYERSSCLFWSESEFVLCEVPPPLSQGARSIAAKERLVLHVKR